MKATPPFLLGIALLLWGWQSGLWWAAVPLALVLEAPRWNSTRKELSDRDLERLWNLCASLIAAFFLYLVFSNDGGIEWLKPSSSGNRFDGDRNRSQEIMRRLLEWLPIWTSPMMMAQAWGTQSTMSLGAFSWYLRRYQNNRQPGGLAHRRINISWPYVSHVLLGACVGRNSPAFPWALIAWAGWALWAHHGRHRFRVSSIAKFVLASGLALVAQTGLRPVSAWTRSLESRWLNAWFDRSPNANESRTFLGQLGALKNSGRIVFRIQSSRGNPVPALMREAVYDTMRGTTWVNASRHTFSEITSAVDDGAWTFGTNDPARSILHVWLAAAQQRILPRPENLTRIEHLPSAQLETNGLGVLRATQFNFGVFDVHIGTRESLDPTATLADLTIPPSELEPIRAVAQELGLDSTNSPQQTLAAIARHFEAHFSYSVYQAGSGNLRKTSSQLSTFLQETRRGHCEYFATATTLLLRQAGIPARYVVGWSLPGAEGQWTRVRARHAHAWTLALVDGIWREIDNTPGTWNIAEFERRSRWEMLGDAGSRMLFAWNRFRNSTASDRRWIAIPALLVPGLFLVEFFRRRGSSRLPRAPATDPRPVPGLDSEFYQVAKALVNAGHARELGEGASHGKGGFLE